MDHDFAILSPEKTILTYRLAGVGSRILAHVIDLLIVVGAIIAISLISTVIELFASGIGQVIALMANFLVPFLYFILSEWLWNGQTLGKRATGLRVRMLDGTPITFPAALGRNLLRPADFLPALYFTGFVCMFTNPRSQRLGDLACGTIVCHEKQVGPLYSSAPHAVGIHPFEDKVCNLRGMTLDEYTALRRLCDRFPELTDDRQRLLMEDIWAPFAERRKIPVQSNVHPLYLAEAVVMKYGREHGLL
ncbi:RDD family protein [soil metagenome]